MAHAQQQPQQRQRAYMTLEQRGVVLGTLHLELYSDTVPKTVHNFVTLLQRGGSGEGYRGCTFHRIIPNFMAQGGDYENGDGTGGKSIYNRDGTFEDENFLHRHDRPGILSMANSGRNTNGSQFFITFGPTPHLDGKHVVFGHVLLNDNKASASVLQALERVPTNKKQGDNRPLEPVVIVDCGLLQDKDNDNDNDNDTNNNTKTSATVVGENPTDTNNDNNGEQVKDDDEIDLDDEQDDQQEEEKEPASEEGGAQQPMTKAERLKQRMRQLKQKMNQARQLNRRAIQDEGERATSSSYNSKKGASQKQPPQQQPQYLTEQAFQSVSKATQRAEKEQLQQYDINDTYNPEGQYRNYQRSLKSVPSSHPQQQHQSGDNNSAMTSTAAAAAGGSAMAIYSPLDSTVDPEQERVGAKRLAEELHRRIEKRQKRLAKEQVKDMQQQDESDVSYINERNRRFNQKINRTYKDKQTAEIRQNLERGTAL